jgi:hypothetical protein
VAGTGDFNGDGKDDILWRNDSGVISDWLGQAEGTFIDNFANAANGAAGTSWQVAGTGDFNGDGRTDILWRNSDGTIDDFLGQANGGFIDNYAVAMQPLSNDLQIAGVGNFDGDGRADVLIRESDGTVQTWVGSTNGAILSPAEKVWQDAIAGVTTFINEITHQIETAPPPPSDKDSGETGLRYIPGPILTGVLDMLGQITEVFDAGGVNVINVMPTGDDSTFDLLYQDDTSFGVSFENSLGSNFDSMTILDSSNSLYSFDINGNNIVASWFAGSTIGLDVPSSDAMVVTGILAASSPNDPMAPPAGYLLFNPFDNNFNFNDGFGGGTHAPTPAQIIASHVTIQGIGSAHLTAAKQAQQNVTHSLQAIDAQLRAVPSTTEVTWDGQTTTAGAVLNILENENWVLVEPGSLPANGGVGAISGTTDKLAYTSFTPTTGSWADPVYNGQNMEFIMLHELGHMSGTAGAGPWYINGTGGVGQNFENYAFSTHDPITSALPWNGSNPYWLNNEAFANNFAETAAGALGVNISTAVTDVNASPNITGGSVWVDPQTIFTNDGGKM